MQCASGENKVLEEISEIMPQLISHILDISQADVALEVGQVDARSWGTMDREPELVHWSGLVVEEFAQQSGEICQAKHSPRLAQSSY